MKIVAISDTHRKHKDVNVPNGNMLIFAGDGDWRKGSDFIEFIDWFASHPHEYKIMISGNHDFFLDQATKTKRGIYINECFTREILYLENSGAEVAGYNIWGSPTTPRFNDWAFMKERGDDISKVWNQIPDDTDILITHGPALKKLDRVQGDYENLGCFDLARRISYVKPKLHICGHIHSASGVIESEGTIYCNASVLDEYYEIAYEPNVIELPDK